MIWNLFVSCVLYLGISLLLIVRLQASTVTIDTPMAPPGWALLERELLRSQNQAIQLFFERYFDERGYLRCVERWGGNDGPDDAMENMRDWTTLHSLGGSDSVLRMFKKAWEGHLRQYTEARTTDIEFAREGMYYKEFPVMMDWMHTGEGLLGFFAQGLSDPGDADFRRRMRRYAGFYMGEDPAAPNYDPQHKIIRSLFNGSRGPLLRPTIALDWAGDPFQVEGRFKPRHGESSYEEFLEHFKDYNDVVGDHPLNLAITELAVSAYMLDQEEKYRKWVLEYVDAWRERMLTNGGIIPSNIGLDGTIGGATGGKWYGGVYGWAFSPFIPGTDVRAHRNEHSYGLVGLTSAYLLTGDRKYLDPWGKQIDQINAQSKVVDGQTVYPQMYGDQGWHHYTPAKYDRGALELYYLTMDRRDLARLPRKGWIAYLEGKNPGYPEQALRADLEIVRRKVKAIRKDPTTPDTRLSDDVMDYNPATVGRLIQLMLGGLHQLLHSLEYYTAPTQDMDEFVEMFQATMEDQSGHRGGLLHCRVRYFDPERRRAGIPEDVAALVDRLSADETGLTLVNVSQLQPRTVLVQGGAYGEHQCLEVRVGDEIIVVDRPFFQVRLAPGAGARLLIRMKRYANRPTLVHPWDR